MENRPRMVVFAGDVGYYRFASDGLFAGRLRELGDLTLAPEDKEDILSLLRGHDVLCSRSPWRRPSVRRDPECAFPDGRLITTLQQAAAESALPGELLSGMPPLRQAHRQPLLSGVSSAGQFTQTGPCEPLSEAESKVADVIAGSSHEPDTDRLGRMMTVCERACRPHGVAPTRMDG